MEAIDDWNSRLLDSVTRPARSTSKRWWIWVGFLSAIVAWGAYAFSLQLRDGLVVTNMRDRPSWGLYISAFVFFTGISQAGTLISAILRVANSSWRAPITRLAELITAIALAVGALFIVVDMGRPDRLVNVFMFGRWQSPIMWDVMAITTYFTASLLYFYTPMMPDLALFRDQLGETTGRFRRYFWRKSSLGWSNTPKQKRAQQRAVTLLMIVIIPIAVSVHTVVSWIFGMTLRVGWNTTLFGVLFVAGALFSGIATLVIIMAIFRRIFKWEEYVTEKHFLYLGYLLAAFAAFMIYLNVTEYLTTGFKLEEGEEFAFRQLFLGEFSSLFWFYLIAGLLVPLLLMVFPHTRTIKGVVIAAILINLAMFIERYLIVVTALRVPLMPYEPANYFPSWVEWSVFAGGVAIFILLLTIATKLIPLQAVTEMTEEYQHRLAGELAEELITESDAVATPSPNPISEEELV